MKQIRQCLIIAAGQGSRIQKTKHDVPKPLLPLCGLTLLERNILCAKQAGIRDFYIVVGFRGEEIKAAIDAEKLGVGITFIDNPNWNQPNGVSVLKAAPLLQQPFLLLMSDHIVDPAILKDLVKQPLAAHEVRLAVDPRIQDVFDLDDATKVNVHEDAIQAIGKELTDYNAIDTGIFLCTPALFESLATASESAPPSLTAGMKLLAKARRLRPHEIGKQYWQDVDTPTAYQHAEKILLQSCCKETDGVISRNFNRKISLFLSRWLVKTPLSANVVTFLLTVMGISTYFFMSTGKYLPMLFGAFLFKLVSVLDGVDGEIARLKMTQSKTGAWLDTISDNLTYFAFLFGTFKGLWWRGYIYGYTFTVTMTVVGLLIMVTMAATYVHRYAGSGSFVDLKGVVKPKWILKYLGPLVKRDLFALIFLGVTLVNMPEAILYLALIATHTSWIILALQKPATLTPFALGKLSSPLKGEGE